MDYLNINYESIFDAMFQFLQGNLVAFVVFVLLISNFMSRASSSLIGAWLINILGVFFHEIMHALVGKILFAKPSKLTLIPRKIKTDNETLYALGQVEFRNTTWYNALPSAMAPLLLLFIAFYIENNFWTYFDETLQNYFLYIYLLIVFILNSIPSRQDFKVGFSNIFGVVFWFILLGLIVYFLNIYNITIDF